MVVRRESSMLSRFKYDIAVLVLLVLTGMGAWLNQHPVTFESEDEESPGHVPPPMGDGDVLLILPDTPKRAETFGDMDFSFAWYNTLAQEVGPFRIQRAGAVQPEDLSTVTLVVVPARSAELVDGSVISLIGAFVDAGGSLIVEMPGPAWSSMTGIDEAVLTGRTAKRITAADGSMLQGDFGQHLLDVPLHSRMMRLDTIDLPEVRHNDVLLEVDGVPAHFHRAVGDGHVYVVGFDFGMAITALQQGHPEEDFSILPLESDEDEDAPYTSPWMLVVNAKMLESSVPYADLLERHMLYAPLRSRPAARLWAYPGTYAGALVMTHDERGFGDRGNYMAEFEAESGFTSTYFVSPTEISNEGLDALKEHGTEVALGWHRAQDTVYEPGGVGRLRPYRVALTLVEQLERLQAWSARRITSARVRDLIWDRGYTSTFRKLVHAGVQIDSSYGPAEEGHWGYLFGTGLPFFPLDTNGRPLPLYEFPVAISDRAGFGPKDVDTVSKLLKESRAGFHQVITLDIDADAMTNHPSPATLDTWMGAFVSAGKERHWITNLRTFALFQNGRRQAAVRSSFDLASRTLDAKVDVPANATGHDGTPIPAPAVSVPMRLEGVVMDSVLVDGQPLDLGNLVRTGDGVLALVPISHGVHRIVVHYGGG